MKPILIAHRGLWEEGIPENSLAAFQKALEKKIPIEMDVQLTKDQKVIVFHDQTCKRLTGLDKKIKDCTLEEIKKLTLQNSKETIPTLEEVLALIDGKVLLDIEIKQYYRPFKTTKKTYEVLKEYKGEYIIKSFHLGVPKYYKHLDPSISCGVLIGSYAKGVPKFMVSFLRNLRFLKIYKPDFICYNVKHITEPIIQKIKKNHIALSLYVIRNQEQLKKYRSICDSLVFENRDILK